MLLKKKVITSKNFISNEWNIIWYIGYDMSESSLNRGLIYFFHETFYISVSLNSGDEIWKKKDYLFN
jgi:hypothetical protein